MMKSSLGKCSEKYLKKMAISGGGTIDPKKSIGQLNYSKRGYIVY